ncbi:MFS transporter [Tissierella sp. MB52-C2]|uniref:MFS transporter n=1 Tax=Tissierella sp. MB52-C2 TaxID=3070999 RepID=UPI00280AAC06|nr:MFS transporter [Tissierella sp. MB52-C2]WMM24371.1 MFS transporter [Tissierella sp. MB52-C2]
MNKKVKRLLLLFALGLTYGFMYTLPYMSRTFYDQMIAAMGVTNAQLGSLLSIYAMACTLSYLPGGWIADKFKPKTVLLASTFGNAAICFLLMVTYRSFTMVKLVWFGAAITGGFAFWPALLKGIRLLGSEEEQGRMFGIFEAMNGVASLLINFIMIYVLSLFADNLLLGFKGAVATMGVLCVIAGILIIFLYDEKLTYAEEKTTTTEKISIKDYFGVLKYPAVWIVAIIMFGQVTFIAGLSYLTPYSTGVLGLSLTLAASIGTIRNYATRFIGGPLGGYVSDNVFKSASKGQVVSLGLCAISMAMLLLMPGGNNILIIAVMLLNAIALYMAKGPLYAVISELQVPAAVTGTALAIITVIGYLPDMFVYTLFGKWLDTYGDAGYSRIFIFTIGVTIVSLLVALVAVKLSNKYKKQNNI